MWPTSVLSGHKSTSGPLLRPTRKTCFKKVPNTGQNSHWSSKRALRKRNANSDMHRKAIIQKILRKHDIIQINLLNDVTGTRRHRKGRMRKRYFVRNWEKRRLPKRARVRRTSSQQGTLLSESSITLSRKQRGPRRERFSASTSSPCGVGAASALFRISSFVSIFPL